MAIKKIDDICCDDVIGLSKELAKIIRDKKLDKGNYVFAVNIFFHGKKNGSVDMYGFELIKNSKGLPMSDFIEKIKK